MRGRIETRGLKFFFDRSTGKFVPHVLRNLGLDVIIHDEVYYPNKTIPDMRWVRIWSKRRRIIVQCDKMRDVKKNPAKRDLFVAANARAFLLGGSATRFEMLRMFFSGWGKMCRIIEKDPGPFIYMIDENGHISQRFP